MKAQEELQKESRKNRRLEIKAEQDWHLCAKECSIFILGLQISITTNW
jgi:hypothetical protein